MEDDEAFNAGRGSKLTVFGHVEMDASIMEVEMERVARGHEETWLLQGSGMTAGAVASVTGVRHPVALARWGGHMEWDRQRMKLT